MKPASQAFLRKTQKQFSKKSNMERRIQQIGIKKKKKKKPLYGSKHSLTPEEKTETIFPENRHWENYSANGYPEKLSSTVKEWIKARNPLHELSRENPGILQMGIHYPGSTLFWIKPRLHKLNSFPTPDKNPETVSSEFSKWVRKKPLFHCESRHQKTRALCTDHEETAKTHQGKSWNDFNCDEGAEKLT